MNEKMFQQVIIGPSLIEYKEVDIPEPKSGEVRIKMMRMGICGSDIHVYHGQHPYVTYPLTQGHEVSGVIDKLGEGVEGLKVGCKVTIEPQEYCGECYPCNNGKYNLCEHLKVMGFQTIGAASQYFVISASKVDLLDEDMEYEEGAMIEPLAVAVHACRRTGDIEGKKVAVLGAGPIGNLILQTLKSMNAKSVMVTDISDYRLSLAKECGADYIINTSKKDFGEALFNAFGKDKADIIFDCAGNDVTMDQAIQNARKGSEIILVAVFSKKATIDLAKLNDSEIDLNTSMMYRHEDYMEAIRIVCDKRIKLAPLMTKHFGFKEFKEAYEYIDNNKEATMKVFIDIDRIN